MRGCCSEHHYRIGLTSYSWVPFYDYDPVNSRGPPTNGFSGFVPELIDTLAAEMGFTYEFIPGTYPQLFFGLLAPTGRDGGFLGFLGGSVDLTVYTTDTLAGGEDGGCGVVPSANCLLDYQSSEVANSISPGFAQTLLTTPFYTSRYSYLVKVTQSDQTIWRLFEPFTPEVWCAVAVVLVSIALLIALIELLYPSTRRRRERPLRDRTWHFVQDIPKALYSTTAACLGGEDYEWAKTWPMRILRCALLLFIVVLVSTYTANLASFFTRPSQRLHGPRDEFEAIRSKICVRHGYLSSAIVQRFTNPYDTLPGTRENPFTEANGFTIAPEVVSAGYDYCINSIQQEHSAAMVDDVNLLRTLLARDCDRVAEASWLAEFGLIQGVFMASGRSNFGKQLQVNLTKALTLFVRTDTYLSLNTKHFSTRGQCPASTVNSELQRVTLHQMLGLFVLVGVIAGSATFLAVGQKSFALVRKRGVPLRGSGRSSDRDTGTKRSSDGELDPVQLAKDAASTNGEMLRALLVQMKLQQDEMSEMRRELSRLQDRDRSDESGAAPAPVVRLTPASVVEISQI